MSITHKLIFNSKSEPLKVQEMLLGSNIGLREEINDRMRGEAVHSWISTTRTEYDEDYFEDYGVWTNRTVYFDMDSHEDEDEGHRIVGQMIAKILESEKGDAVFLFLSEVPILKRINEQLSIKPKAGLEWLPEELNKARITYEIKSDLSLIRADVEHQAF